MEDSIEYSLGIKALESERWDLSLGSNRKWCGNEHTQLLIEVTSGGRQALHFYFTPPGFNEHINFLT